MRRRTVALTGAAAILVIAITAWALHARAVDHWLAIHTGTVDEPGPYYAFWSGFGSDIAEVGLLSAVATTAYQTVKKYNCHEPRCWRIGNHPAAGGRFSLCYRHHPDYQGKRPSAEIIARLHSQHAEHEGLSRQRNHQIDSGNYPANSRRRTESQRDEKTARSGE